MVVVEKGLVVVLAVEIDEEASDFAEGADGDGSGVEADGGAAVGGDVALDDEASVFEFDAFLGAEGESEGVGAEVGDKADGAFASSGADKVAVGASAEGEADTVDEEGFAGAGLAGEGREAGPEFKAGLVDDGDIFDGELKEHGFLGSRRLEGGKCGGIGLEWGVEKS